MAFKPYEILSEANRKHCIGIGVYFRLLWRLILKMCQGMIKRMY